MFTYTVEILWKILRLFDRTAQLSKKHRSLSLIIFFPLMQEDTIEDKREEKKKKMFYILTKSKFMIFNVFNLHILFRNKFYQVHTQ